MGYTWLGLEESRLGFGRLEGVVTGREILDAAHRFFSDPDWRAGDLLLWDNRGIMKLAITPEEAGEILERARALKQHLGDGRAAAVIKSDLRMMGEHLIQMSELDPERVRLFGSLKKAAEWLGIPVDLVRAYAEQHGDPGDEEGE